MSGTGVGGLSASALAGSLPTLPAVALDVLRVCDDPNAEIGELAEIVARDPMLASRVLQVANSAFYNRGGEVTSLQRAAMMMGLRSLKVVALGFTLTRGLPQRGAPAGFDLGRYWHRSLVDAVIARGLAQAIDPSAAEEAFVCGLLSEIGKLALAQAMPESYAAAVAAGDGWPSAEIERASLGFSASEAAELLLRSWGVPEVIVHGATYADRLARLPIEVGDHAQELTAIVGLAQVGTAIVFGDQAGDTLMRFAEAGRRLGLSAEAVDGLVSRLATEVDDAATVLAVDLPAGVTADSLLQQARLLLVSYAVDASAQLEHRTRRIEQLERDNAELEAHALTDILTGLPNRAALEAFLEQQVSLRLREELPGNLGVLMLDLDHFGAFNDAHGIEAGDVVLRAVAAALAAVARESDVLGRYGGEEFCLAVPHSTPETLTRIAERFRLAVEGLEIDLGAGAAARVTVSFGAAHIAKAGGPEDAAAVIAAAEKALRRAKDAGRNRGAIAPGLRTAPASVS